MEAAEARDGSVGAEARSDAGVDGGPGSPAYTLPPADPYGDTAEPDRAGPGDAAVPDRVGPGEAAMRERP